MTPARCSLTVLAALLAVPAQAAEVPKRKSGLWEMKTQMAGIPPQGPIQMCIDQASDNLMQERAREKANCPVVEVNRSSGRLIIHSVCKYDSTTATSDAVVTGDFDSAYRNDMAIRYDPPQHGMKEMKMVQEARWLGPCKPGQKPGDVMMPGRPAMNMQDMLKDPQRREMPKNPPAGR